MFFGIKDLLLHPDAFFERASQEKVNMIPPLAIVGIGMLFMLFLLVFVLIYSSLTSSYNLSSVGWAAMIQVYLRCYVAIPLIIWGVPSLGSYGISRILDGKGSLTATVQNIGYGMIPWSISVIGTTIFSGILFCIAYIFPTTVIVMEEFVSYGLGTVLFIYLIILFWGWYLWILAIRHTQNFTFRKAAAVSIIPVMIVIWLTTPVQAWIDTIRMIVSGT